MHFRFRNVNDAFHTLVRRIDNSTVPTVVRESRAGRVRMIEEPVTVTYEQPQECVLFNPARDCNPFFHLFEALWMLAGRNDVAPLLEFNPRMTEFSDDGETQNDAYGYRWQISTCFTTEFDQRGHQPYRVNQLSEILRHLKQNPGSRRAVLQMWNVEDDLLKVDNSKAVCCNTHVYFALRDDHQRVLDMTVCNRSNDLVWGMLGSNAVTFSLLQQYIACCLGVAVGRYHQFTNNLHVYESNWKPTEWLLGQPEKQDEFYWVTPQRYHTVRLVQNPAVFDDELKQFIDDPLASYAEPFLLQVAKPLVQAFRLHKRRLYKQAKLVLEHEAANCDWTAAAHEWIKQREYRWERKMADETRALEG
jgi:thymidylate synthase